MELWRHAWRNGIQPLLSRPALLALAEGLRHEDPRICQRITVVPAPGPWNSEWPIEACCPIGYCGWKTGMHTPAGIEGFFEAIARNADEKLSGITETGWKTITPFLDWFDSGERTLVMEELLAEVEQNLKERE